MLELKTGKNRIFIKAASLILAQVFLFTGLTYPHDFSCLRSPVMFNGKTDRVFQAEEGIYRSTLNDYFGILAGDKGKRQAEAFVQADSGAWVMFGDMSGIRLMNTAYNTKPLDVLIPMTVVIIRGFLKHNKYKGLVTRIGLKGDEICLALSSEYTPGQADKIRQDAQEKVASSITDNIWGCKVKISKDGKPLDLDNIALYDYVSSEAKKIIGGDMLSGFYRDEDGVFMIFKDEDMKDLSRSINMLISSLNNELTAKDFNISFDNSISPFGLLSPRVLFGATRFSGNLEETEHRAEVILNITKQNGMEGGTEGVLDPDFTNRIPKTGDFKTEEKDREEAIQVMMPEEISGVKIYPEDFEPTYLALRQNHLAPVLENTMLLVLSQAMVRHTSQPVLLGLLDCCYQPYGEAWASLEGKEDFNTPEKRAKGLRGQVDKLFGEIVAFKYFNDALEGGHNLGNKVLEKEAKAILNVIKALKRQNIILFRGPPDNWYFVFLGPSAQDFSEDPEQMKQFVDDISDAFDNAFQGLGLQVKARLRMNIVSSQENMRGPFTIINQVKRIARSRNQNSLEISITNREAGANKIKLYKEKKRETLNTELGAIRAEERNRAIGFLTEKIMKQIKERANRNAVTPNDLATIRVMEQSGWLTPDKPLASGQTISLDMQRNPLSPEIIVSPGDVFDEDSVKLISVLKQLTLDNNVEGCSWTAVEIWEELTKGASLNGTVMSKNSAWKKMDKLSKMRGSGVKAFGATKKTYRYEIPSDDIVWKGMNEEKFPESISFRTHNDFGFFKYLWDNQVQTIANQYNDKYKSDRTSKEVFDFAVKDMLEAYKILNKEQKIWTLQNLLKELQKQRIETVIYNETVLGQALKWLEMKDFPVFLSKDKCFVSGVNRNFIHVPPAIVLETRENSSNKAIADRILLVMQDAGLTWDDMNYIVEKVYGVKQSLYSLYRILEKGKTLREDRLDTGLEIFGKILGRESIWLRTGFSKAEMEARIFKSRPYKTTIGMRIKELRQIEGINQRVLARKLNWSIGRLSHLERLKQEIHPHGNQLVPNQNDWKDIANAFGLEDAFYILTGFNKDEAINKLSQGDYIRIARLAEGMTQPALANKIGVTVASIVMWENNEYPPTPKHMQMIADLFGVDKRVLFKSVLAPDAASAAVNSAL